MSTRGIVTLAGGPVYFLNAYINCRMLRHIGCTLPIEWFFLGAEMQLPWVKKIMTTIPNIKMIDLGGTNKKNYKHNGGWQNKVNAVIQSSFEQVMFLDADCFPLHNPEYLFDDPFFKDTGCVLWPDLHDWEADKLRVVNKKYKVSLPKDHIETGQMMFTEE